MAQSTRNNLSSVMSLPHVLTYKRPSSEMCNLTDGGLIELETCRRDITNDKLLCVIDCAICCNKHYIFSVLQEVQTTLTFICLLLACLFLLHLFPSLFNRFRNKCYP